MKDENKTNKQLIDELVELRHRLNKFEKSEIDSKQEEEKIEHLNRVLRAIRNVNQLIIMGKDLDRLNQRVCDILIETRGYHNAWIALFDKAGGLVATAESGLGEDFLPMVEQLKRGELTTCGRQALSQSEVVVTENPPSTCGDCPLAAIYQGRGGMTVRLEHGGNVYGLLCVSIPAHLAVDEEEQDIFKEVANDIAFALHNMEVEEERKLAEEEIRRLNKKLEQKVEKRTDELGQSEERFKAIAKTVHDAIIIIDNKGIISFWNQASKKMFGYSNMEALGKELHLLIAPQKYYDAYQKGMKVFQREGKGPQLGKTLELVAVRKNKKEFPVELSISSLEIAGKHHVVGIIRDITKRKRLQEELIRKDRLALLGQLAGGVAHELRNPLGTIKNAAYFLNMSLKKPGKNTKEMLKVMEEEITTASDTIDTLLDFASPDVLTKIEVDVNNALQKALSRINIPGNIEVITQLDRTVPLILADPNQIERAFGNIALNAIQAMPKGGRLTIKSKSVNSKQILVSFKDNGIGIRKNDMGMLFEPLFTSKAKGIGLGLALTRLFIHRSGGIIEVQSKKNTGSTFSIKLPVITKK